MGLFRYGKTIHTGWRTKEDFPRASKSSVNSTYKKQTLPVPVWRIWHSRVAWPGPTAFLSNLTMYTDVCVDVWGSNAILVKMTLVLIDLCPNKAVEWLVCYSIRNVLLLHVPPGYVNTSRWVTNLSGRALSMISATMCLSLFVPHLCSVNFHKAMPFKGAIGYKLITLNHFTPSL